MRILFNFFNAKGNGTALSSIASVYFLQLINCWGKKNSTLSFHVLLSEQTINTQQFSSNVSFCFVNNKNFKKTITALDVSIAFDVNNIQSIYSKNTVVYSLYNFALYQAFLASSNWWKVNELLLKKQLQQYTQNKTQKIIVNNNHTIVNEYINNPHFIDLPIPVIDINFIDKAAEKNIDSNYFLYLHQQGSNLDAVGVLKAFSIFKKWQKSSFKLCIIDTDNTLINNTSFNQLLNSYKYKTDVILQSLDICFINYFIKNAYAVIITHHHYNSLFLWQTVVANGGLPIIGNTYTINHSFSNNEAVFFNENEFESLSKCLLLLYKDESLYGVLKNEFLAYKTQHNFNTWLHKIEALLVN